MLLRDVVDVEAVPTFSSRALILVRTVAMMEQSWEGLIPVDDCGKSEYLEDRCKHRCILDEILAF